MSLSVVPGAVNEQMELQRRVAIAEAKRLGHLLTRFSDPVSDGARQIRTAHCMECGDDVRISISNKMGRGRRWGDPLIFPCKPDVAVQADLRLYDPERVPTPEPAAPDLSHLLATSMVYCL